jgi:DeoR/GlpR family transcriptional regulator of sugar metabolism
MVMPAEASEPEEEILKFLTLEGPARVEKLVEMTTVSRATVYRRLAAYEANGRVHKAGGLWRAGPAPAGASEDEAGAA